MKRKFSINTSAPEGLTTKSWMYFRMLLVVWAFVIGTTETEVQGGEVISYCGPTFGPRRSRFNYVSYVLLNFARLMKQLCKQVATLQINFAVPINFNLMR